ncbi:MAG: hypothetical protein AB7T37_03290 [Dehalococcoidia bacterium]
MKLQFEAALGDVKIKSGKAADTDYGQPKAGELSLTLVIRQPMPSREPEIGYGWKDRQRPEDPVQEEGESKAAFTKRASAVRADQQRWDEYMAEFAERHAKWEQERDALGPRTAAYPLLAGAGAVLGAGSLLVTIEPGKEQPGLPGFDVQLLPLLGAG